MHDTLGRSILSRRALLAAAAAFAASAQTPSPAIMKPKALREGDTVGLITPSTAVTDPEKLATAERTVRYFGLVPKWGKHVGERAGYLGGSIEARLEDLHAMFADPAVKAVFCIRGGYGSGQLLNGIDYDLIRRNPKIFLGYSDITAMHLAIHRMTGLVTFHGPVPLSAFTTYTQINFRNALFQAVPLGRTDEPRRSQHSPSGPHAPHRPSR